MMWIVGFVRNTKRITMMNDYVIWFILAIGLGIVMVVVGLVFAAVGLGDNHDDET